MTEVGKTQLKLIEKAKEYLQKNLSNKVNVHSSSFCYFPSYGINPGYAKLKLWEKGTKNIFNSFAVFCKDIIAISLLHNHQITNNSKKVNAYNKIIVSWAIKENFLPDGSFYDRYFQTNSRKISDSLWFLVGGDEILQKKVDNNIIIFTKKSDKKKYNFFLLLKIILKNIINSKFNINKILHKICWSAEYSKIVFYEFNKFVNNNVEKVIMPYEAQPFQNTIFREIKKINKNIKTIGYVHAFPAGLPSSYIFRDGSPDELILNSEEQQNCFVNYLNWDRGRLRILPSARYQINSKNMSGYIYLPYTIKSSNRIIKLLEEFILQYDKKDIQKLIVKNHPLKKNSRIHGEVVKKIDNLLIKYDSFFSKNSTSKQISVFFGATSASIEALERGVDEVIHICDDPVFDSYSSVLWPSLKVIKINDNIFKYQLLKKGNLIELGNDNEIFKKFYFN